MNCQMLPSGSIPLFFRQNIPLYHRSPAVPPLFFLQNIPQYHSASDTAPSIFQACQFLPGCESFNKRPLPAGNTQAGHTTRAGKDSHSIMIVIIIMISIRWIYIYFILFYLTCFFLLSSWPFLIHKKKVFICDGVMVWYSWWYCWVWFSFGLGLSDIITHLIWHIR